MSDIAPIRSQIVLDLLYDAYGDPPADRLRSKAGRELSRARYHTADPDEDRIRAAAAGWITRIEHGATPRLFRNLDRWRNADPRHEAAYQRMAQHFEGARVLRQSRRFAARPQAVRRPARIVMTGAVLAAVLLVTFLLSPTLRPPILGTDRPIQTVASTSNKASTLRRHIAAPIAAIGAAGLADGSVVTLDTGSAIDLVFSGAARRVRLLRGHARFEVAHDGRPFTVFAGGGSVTARGTIFDVTLDPRGRVAVALLRGAVDVSAVARFRNSGPYILRLTDGQGAGFSGEALPVSNPAGVADTHWVDHATEFDAVLLGYLLDRANQGAVPPIRASDPSLLQLRVSGRFDIRDHARLARNLATLLDLRADIHSDAVVLRRD